MSHSSIHFAERVGFSVTQHQRSMIFRRTLVMLMYYSVPHNMLFRNIRKTPNHMKSEHERINIHDTKYDGDVVVDVDDDQNSEEKEVGLSKQDWESMRSQSKEFKIWERQMRRKRLEAVKPTVSSSRDLLQMIYEGDQEGAVHFTNTSTKNETAGANNVNSENGMDIVDDQEDVRVEHIESEEWKKKMESTSNDKANRSKKSHRRESTFNSSQLFSVKPMPKINSTLNEANGQTVNREREPTTERINQTHSVSFRRNNEDEKKDEAWMHTVHTSGVSYVLLLKLLESVQRKRINWSALLLHYPELAALPLFAEKEYWCTHYCNVNAASPLESFCSASSAQQDETAASERKTDSNSLRSMINESKSNNKIPIFICTAPTGSGKSVLVPFYILDSHWRELELRLQATIAKYKNEIETGSNSVNSVNESQEMMEEKVEQEFEEEECRYIKKTIRPFPLINKESFISAFASCSRIVIVVSQPTRLACVELAKYTASLLQAASSDNNDGVLLSHKAHSTTMNLLNKRVGYAVSGQSSYTNTTELIYATPGYIITAMQKQQSVKMQNHKNNNNNEKELSLEQYTYHSFRPTSLVVDEAHCRNIETDVLLAWVKHYKNLSFSCNNSQIASQKLIPLRQIIIMSATMHRQSMKWYLLEGEYNTIQSNYLNGGNNNNNGVMYMLQKEERDKLKLHLYKTPKEKTKNISNYGDATNNKVQGEEDNVYSEKDGYSNDVHDENDEDNDVKEVFLKSGPFRVERYFIEDLQDGSFFKSEVLFAPWLHHNNVSNHYRRNDKEKSNWESSNLNGKTQNDKLTLHHNNSDSGVNLVGFANEESSYLYDDNNNNNSNSTLVNSSSIFDTSKQKSERRDNALNKYFIQRDNRIEGRVNSFHQLPLLLRDDGKLIIAGLLQQLPFTSFVSGSFGRESISKNMLQGKLRHLHSIYEENDNVNESKRNKLPNQTEDKSLIATQMYTMALNTGQNSKNNMNTAGSNQNSVLSQSNALATLVVNLLHILEFHHHHHNQSAGNVHHHHDDDYLSSSLYHAEMESSTILVFLPGFSEMQALASALEIMCEKLYLPLINTTQTHNSNKKSNIDYVHNFVSVFRRSQFTFSLVLLHGSAIGSPQEQLSISSEYALQHKVPLRVILATSIAESSLTIPNVRVVMDLCQERNFVADDLTGVMQRRTRYIVNPGVLRQRCGRTGRTCDGVVLHLVPRKWYEQPRLTLPSNTNVKKKNNSKTEMNTIKQNENKYHKESVHQAKWPHRPLQLEPLSESVTTILLRVKYLFGSTSFAPSTTLQENTSLLSSSSTPYKEMQTTKWEEGEEETGAIIASLPCPPDELQLEAAYHQLIDANILLPPRLPYREYCSLYNNHLYDKEKEEEVGEIVEDMNEKRERNIYSSELLYYLNHSQLTTRGYIVASFPLPHELGMFLYHALHFSCVEDAILIASAMSVPSLFVAPRLTDKSSIVYHYRNREAPAFVTNEAMLSIAQMPITGAPALSPLEQFYKLLWIQRHAAGFATPTLSLTSTASSSSSSSDSLPEEEELEEKWKMERQHAKPKIEEEWQYQEKFCQTKSIGNTTTSPAEQKSMSVKCKLNESKGHYYSEPLMLRSVMLKWYAARNTHDLWSIHISHNLNRSVMRMVDLTVAQCCQRLIELISSEITSHSNENNTKRANNDKEKMYKENYDEESRNIEKIDGRKEEMCEYCGQDWGEGVSSGDYNSEYDQYCRESVLDLSWPHSYKVQLIKSLQRLRQAALCRTAIRAGVNPNSAFVQWYGADEHLTHILKTHYTSPVQTPTTSSSELSKRHPSTSSSSSSSSSSSILLRQQSIEPVLRSMPQPQLPTIHFNHPTLQRAIKITERKEFARLMKAEQSCMDKTKKEVEEESSEVKVNVTSNPTLEIVNCAEENSNKKDNTDKLQSLIHRLSRKSTIPASKREKLLASLSVQQHKQEKKYRSESNMINSDQDRNSKNTNKVAMQKRKIKKRKVSRLALLIQAKRNVAEWFQSSRVANPNSSSSSSLQSHRTPIQNNNEINGCSPFTFSYTFGTLEDRLCAAFIATFARYTLKGEDGTHRVHHRRLIRNLSVLEDDSSQTCTCNVEVKPIQSMSIPTRYNSNTTKESSLMNNNSNNNSSWRDLLTTNSISQALIPFFRGTGLKQIEMFASHRSIAMRFANETSELCNYSGLFTSEQLENGFDNKYVAFHASKAAMLESSFLDGTKTNNHHHHDNNIDDVRNENQLVWVNKENGFEQISEISGRSKIEHGNVNKSVLLEPVVLSLFHAKKSQEQRDALPSSSSSLSSESTKKFNNNWKRTKNEDEHSDNRTSANELVRLAPFGVSLLIAASMSLQRIPITLQPPEPSLAVNDKSVQAERKLKNTNTTEKDISNNNDGVNLVNSVNSANQVKTGHVMDSNHNTVTWKDVFGAPYTIDVSSVKELGLNHLLPTNAKATVKQVGKDKCQESMSNNKLRENKNENTNVIETDQILKDTIETDKECEPVGETVSSNLLQSSSEKEITNKATSLINTKPTQTSAFLSIQSPINVTRMIYWKVAMPSLSWLVERYRLRRINYDYSSNYYGKSGKEESVVNVLHDYGKSRTLSTERLLNEQNDCDELNDDLPRVCEVCNMLCLRHSFFEEHCQTNAHLAHLQFAIEHHITCDQLNLINGNTSQNSNDTKNKNNIKAKFSDGITSLLQKGTRVNTGNINVSNQNEGNTITCSSATINQQSTRYAWDDLVSKSGSIDQNIKQKEINSSFDFEMNDEKGGNVEFRSELKPCRLSHLSFLNALQWNNYNSNDESIVAPLAVAGGLTSSFVNNEVELPPMAMQGSTQHRPYLQSHKKILKNDIYTVNPSSSTSSLSSVCSHVNVDENSQIWEQKEKEDDDNVISNSRWANNILSNATAPLSLSSSSLLLRNGNASRPGMLTAQHVWILNQVNNSITNQTSSLFILAGYLAASSTQFALALLVNQTHSHVFAIMLYDWSVFKLPLPLTMKQLDALRRPSQGRGWCGLVHLNNDEWLSEEEEFSELSECKTQNNAKKKEISTELHWCIPVSTCPHHTIHNGMKLYKANMQRNKKEKQREEINLHESEQERVKMLQRASSARSYNNNNNIIKEEMGKNKESGENENVEEENTADNMIAATLLIVLHECKLGYNNIIRMSNFTERVIAKLDVAQCSNEHNENNNNELNCVSDNKHVYGIDLLCTFLRHRQNQSLHSLLRDLGCQFLTPPSALSLLDLLTSDNNISNNSKSISQILSSRAFSEGASLEVSFTLPPILPSVLPSAEFGAIIQDFASPSHNYKFNNMSQGSNININSDNNSSTTDLVDAKDINYSQLLDEKACNGVDDVLHDVSSTPQF